MKYWQAIEEYKFRYPYIRHLINIHDRWTKPPSVTVLQFWPDHVDSKRLDSLDELRSYLRHNAAGQEDQARGFCRHNLYLVEDLNGEVIDILGGHFWIDPYLFASQASASFYAPTDRHYGNYARPMLPLSSQRRRLESYRRSLMGHQKPPASVSAIPKLSR